MLFDFARGLKEGTSGLYTVQTNTQLMKRCRFQTRYHSGQGYIHPMFLQTVHEATLKEFGTGEDEDTSSDNPPLIKQIRMIRTSSRNLTEVEEIMLQRDYVKESFCILFQNGQAACIV